eukprot:12674472-Alexandrium_andersonii.AAC.1
MSASLVGSEMCIRDSLRCVESVLPLELHGFRTRTRARRPPAISRASTVSYTHLTLPTICSV